MRKAVPNLTTPDTVHFAIVLAHITRTALTGAEIVVPIARGAFKQGHDKVTTGTAAHSARCAVVVVIVIVVLTVQLSVSLFVFHGIADRVAVFFVVVVIVIVVVVAVLIVKDGRNVNVERFQERVGPSIGEETVNVGGATAMIDLPKVILQNAVQTISRIPTKGLRPILIPVLVPVTIFSVIVETVPATAFTPDAAVILDV